VIEGLQWAEYVRRMKRQIFIKLLVGNNGKGVMCETLAQWVDRENVFCCEINCDDVNWIGLPVESIDRHNCNGEKCSVAA